MGLGLDIAITWFGHATFVIRTPGGKRVMIDPWLQANPACPPSLKEPGPLDAILVTHGHFDHTGDLIAVAKSSGAALVGTYELTTWAEGQGVRNTVGMNLGGAVQVAGLKVHMVRADHSSSLSGDGGLIYAGAACGYVIELENGHKLYDSGDTALFSDMTLIGELHHPQLAMLPIGGHFTMGPAEAARACRMLGVKHVIPQHYATFPILTQSADPFVEAAKSIHGLTVHVMKPGDTLE